VLFSHPIAPTLW